MNKPVSPWKGTAGLHKEEKAKTLPKKISKSEKKGIRKIAVRMKEKEIEKKKAK